MRSFWRGLGRSEAKAASRRRRGAGTTTQLAKGAEATDGAARGGTGGFASWDCGKLISFLASQDAAGGQICSRTLGTADLLSQRRGIPRVFSCSWPAGQILPHPQRPSGRPGPPGSSAPGQPLNFLPNPGKRAGLGAGRARDAARASGQGEGWPVPKVTCRIRSAARLCHAKEETPPLQELPGARESGGSLGCSEDEPRRGACFGLLRLPPPSPGGQRPSWKPWSRTIHRTKRTVLGFNAAAVPQLISSC
ncbi:uncharacterized protein M6D78_015882 [Vipera latastei]